VHDKRFKIFKRLVAELAVLTLISHHGDWRVDSSRCGQLEVVKLVLLGVTDYVIMGEETFVLAKISEVLAWLVYIDSVEKASW
jgi:hypothetical protein